MQIRVNGRLLSERVPELELKESQAIEALKVHGMAMGIAALLALLAQVGGNFSHLPSLVSPHVMNAYVTLLNHMHSMVQIAVSAVGV